jgi:N-acetylglucosamine kinase-like BadF-type ATPase
MRAVSFEWTGRGPATALTQAFLQKTGAKNLDDLIEGIYLGRFTFDQSDALMVFDAAAQGDFQAIEVIRWAGDELGQMACGVINQIGIQTEAFEVVLIGSLFNGYPLLASSLGQTVHHVAPEARLINLTIPPVVGGVLLGMEVAGIDSHSLRTRLILSTKALLNGVPA